jgi:protein-L-isoaspartate(D-aspartate) O-methyltransferase
MDYAAARATMIESQVRTNDVSDLSLQAAIRLVPREGFVVEARRPFAYAEVLCDTPSGRTLWMPRDVAKLAQVARALPGETVLVIAGAGGYSAALFAAMGCAVTLFDDRAPASDAPLSGVEVVVGDLDAPPQGPFDIVFVDGAVELIPETWGALLREGGRLCVVVAEGPVGKAQVLTKAGGVVSGRVAFDASVPRLPGFERAKSFVF